MATDRREFFLRAAALAAGLSVPELPLPAQQGPLPTPRARAFMDRFGLRVPIANAGMGTYATPELAIAVSEAGGLGAVGTGLNPVTEVVQTNVRRARAGTARLFA